jgi:hypothetical protein
LPRPYVNKRRRYLHAQVSLMLCDPGFDYDYRGFHFDSHVRNDYLSQT